MSIACKQTGSIVWEKRHSDAHGAHMCMSDILSSSTHKLTCDRVHKDTTIRICYLQHCAQIMMKAHSFSMHDDNRARSHSQETTSEARRCFEAHVATDEPGRATTRCSSCQSHWMNNAVSKPSQRGLISWCQSLKDNAKQMMCDLKSSL